MTATAFSPTSAFTDGNGAEFYKSGSTLYITQDRERFLHPLCIRATRYLPSAAKLHL